MTIDPPPTARQAMQSAQRLISAGRLGEAEAVYRRIIAADAGFHPAYHGLALLAFQVGRLALAAELLTNALTLAPGVVAYHRDRGEICRRLGRLDDAVHHGREATRHAPADAEAHYNLGLALADLRDVEGAIASYRRAIEIDPGHGRAWNNLGSVIEQQGDREAAADAYRTAIAIDDAHMEAHNNLGSVLGWMGHLDGARVHLERALALDPRAVPAHYNLGALKRYTAGDPAIAQLEALAQDAARLPADERAQFWFALGKMRDDVGRYEAAFEAFAEGNRQKTASLRFDEARAIQEVARIRERFTPDLFARLTGTGTPDPTPVFVVGMPRSGTSLAEQILASHPAVHGAGELKDLHRIAGEVARGGSGGSFATAISGFSASDVKTIGERYVDALRPIAPSATRIVDKMPGNFHYLGLIRLALPRARVIHMVRDPMDSCLSCYTHLFKDTMDFTYDLGTLGRYYVRYIELMAHWRTVLPPDMVLDVPYEALVGDLEGWTHRMLDHVGLPWDDRCLAFHETERPVRTASLAQVRRPIYQSSVGRWKRYERQLQPLFEIVRDHR